MEATGARLIAMKYCGECGGQLEKSWIAADARERLVCTACGSIRYENPRILVSTVVMYQDRLLLSRRAQPPSVGKWNLPSGFMEQFETLENAAARETLEETGVQLRPDQLMLYTVTSLAKISEVYVCFRAVVTSDSCAAGVESLDVGFFAEAQIPWEDLAFPEMRSFLQLCFREHSQQRFGIHLSRVDEFGRFRVEYLLAAKV